MLRWTQYRPLLPTTVQGLRQYRRPYVHVSRRNKQMGSPAGIRCGGMGDTFQIGGGMTTGIVVFAGIALLLAYVMGDYAIQGR